MAFVHRQSCEGVKSELDLFTVPPTQNCIIASHVVEHQPTASLDSGGPIEFFIPGSGDDYIDLANTMIHVQVKVTQPNGNDLDAAAPVGPVNNWLHSLWSQVDVSLNGTLVTQSSDTYAYRAYIETLLSHGLGAKSTQLTNQLWYKDKASRMNATELADGADPNPGFTTRREYITGSRVVDMMGRLHVDMFLQDKFLINGVDVKIRLVRSKPAFALMSGGVAPDYKITIVNATLFVKKATLNPAVQVAHINTLEKNTVKYSLRPVSVKVYSIPAGALSHTHENLFLTTLPKRLVLCCIDNDAYNGTYDKNPAQLRGKPLRQELHEPVHLDRQDLAGRRERSDARRLPRRLHLLLFRSDPRPVRRSLLQSGTKGQPAHRISFPRSASHHRERRRLRRIRIRAGNRQESQRHLRLLRWTPCRSLVYWRWIRTPRPSLVALYPKMDCLKQ